MHVFLKILVLATSLVLLDACSSFGSDEDSGEAGGDPAVTGSDSAKAADGKKGADGSDGPGEGGQQQGGGLLGFFSGPAKTKPPLVDEQELKLAKLWARVDELEEEQYRQKERVRVLEKGLTLGLLPEELQKQDKVKEPEPAPKKVEPLTPPPPPEPPVAQGGLSKEDTELYQKALANAHDHYRAGRYGRAIVDYDAALKQWGNKVPGGMERYWIARCWINLKEYNTARQHLVDFLKDHPDSPWVPRAKLELARVEWRLGLGETAIKRFRDIIKDHPYEDAAEMAKMEIQNLDKTL